MGGSEGGGGWGGVLGEERVGRVEALGAKQTHRQALSFPPSVCIGGSVRGERVHQR